MTTSKQTTSKKLLPKHSKRCTVPEAVKLIIDILNPMNCSEQDSVVKAICYVYAIDIGDLDI